MIQTLIDEWSNLGPAAWAENSYGWILEDGSPIKLASWQDVILSEYFQRQEDISTLFISSPKKAGKTLLNSLLTCFRWLTKPGVHFCLGNDFDQAALLQGQMIAEMVKRHSILKKLVKITKDELLFKPTGSRLITLPSDYAGSSGFNWLTCSWTELWAFTLENHVRLFEEMTPPPLVGALRIVDSYAGYSGESTLLERIWRRAESGEKISEELFLSGGQLSFIATDEAGHKKTWRGNESERQVYLTEQRETLREGTFRRLHYNLWQQPIEESFVTETQWEACFNPALKPISQGDRVPLVVALDLSRGATGGDHIGLIAVCKWGERDFAVKFAQNWQPINGQRFNFDETVGVKLDWLISNFVIAQLAYDEFEAQHFVQQFAGKVWLKPFGQQTERTLADSFLYQTIINQRLHHFGDEDLSKHVLMAATEIKNESRLRLVKSTQKRKIDLAVALSMAVYRCNGLNLASDSASIDKSAKLLQMAEAKGLFIPEQPKTERQKLKEFYEVQKDVEVIEAPTCTVAYFGRQQGINLTLSDGSQVEVKQLTPYEITSQTWQRLQVHPFRGGDWKRIVDYG